MRIIAGEYKNAELTVPKSGTRPTTSKLKESLFSSLESRGGVMGKALDLFAGSGALGFEALSRGASSITLVDCSREAAKCLKTNAAPFVKGGKEVKIAVMKAERFLENCSDSFDLVFLDPPYGLKREEFQKIMSASINLLSPGGYIVAEREKEDFLLQGLKAVKIMKSGSTTCEILLKEAQENE